MPKHISPKSYQQLSQQLTDLMEWFESDQVDLDEAVSKYQQALQVIEQMEKYLQTAENTIKKISVKPNDK